MVNVAIDRNSGGGRLYPIAVIGTITATEFTLFPVKTHFGLVAQLGC